MNSVVGVYVACKVDVRFISVDNQILEVGVSCLLCEIPVCKVTTLLVVRSVDGLMGLDMVGAEVEVNAEDAVDSALRDSQVSFSAAAANRRMRDGVPHDSKDVRSGSARAFATTARSVEVLIGVIRDCTLDDRVTVLTCWSGDPKLKREIKGKLRVGFLENVTVVNETPLFGSTSRHVWVVVQQITDESDQYSIVFKELIDKR